MAYSAELVERIRAIVGDRTGLGERPMFGTLAWSIDGNLACCARGEELMVRPHPEDLDRALADPHAGPMQMGSRRMRGWVLVDSAGLETDEDLREWVELGLGYAGSLPAK